jgi:tripeptide aminopeptidase
MSANSRLIELFLRLAAIDGISGAESEVAAFILSFLQGIGLDVFIDDATQHFHGNTGNVIGTKGNGGDFVLVAHMDTALSTKHLSPRLLDDRIKSDGTTILGADNRAGIAAILYSIERLMELKTATYDFTVAFTADEERDLTSSKYLQLSPDVKTGFVFDSHFRPGHYINRTWGAKVFKATFIGKASHASRPLKGINSIKMASVAIESLTLGRIDKITTANVGTIVGGNAANIIPPETHVEGEVRSLESDKLEAKVSEIRDVFCKTATAYEGRCEFSDEWVFRPLNVDISSNACVKLENALKSAGLRPTPMTTPGGSDANNLNAKGIQAVNIGIGAQNPHSTDEFILLEDLQKSAEIVQNLIKKG